MVHEIVVLMGIFILNAVGEEESPVVISQSPDIQERIAIEEDLNHKDDSRTIHIKISPKQSNNDETNRTAGADADMNIKRSTNADSPITKDIERIELVEDFLEHGPELKEGDDTPVREHSKDEFNDSTNSRVEQKNRVLKGFDDILIADSTLDLPESIDMQRDAAVDDLEILEAEGKSMTPDDMLETKGREGYVSDDLFEVRAVPPKDVRTFKSLKPSDNYFLRKRLNDMIVPKYIKALSRTAYPYPPSEHHSTSTRQPNFGGRAYPDVPQHVKNVESIRQTDPRRSEILNLAKTEEELRVLEDYADPDSNAYVYSPLVPQRKAPHSNNNGYKSKVLEPTNQQFIPQFMNPYRQDLRPTQYTVNYPYGFYRHPAFM